MNVRPDSVANLVRAASYSLAAVRFALSGEADPDEVLADIADEIEAALAGLIADAPAAPAAELRAAVSCGGVSAHPADR
jgi:hypothetical protein